MLSAIMPGLDVADWGSALVTAAFIGLANALVWAALVRIALPFTVLTLGLGALLLNGRSERAGSLVIGAGRVRRLDDDHVEAGEAPNEDLVGAEAVHRRFRAWLVALGHEGYR